MAPDDRHLVEAARRGDHAAFRGLVERYQQRVYAMALAMTHDSSDAKDVAQDTFLKAYEHLDSFEDRASFFTWLYRIAMNLCLDRARRRAKRVGVEYDDARRTDGDEEAATSAWRLGFDPARALEDAELRARILAALAELSEAHRAVLVLREWDGLAYQEIADVMGCAVGTVMSRLFHARRQMRQLLRDLAPADSATSAAGDGDGTQNGEAT